ncbi:hypothetical protein PA598K_02096 [Paenibacillus sp. 598K]|nr:hypothetical protein PA598K_02096 [Paenibacillus sp. 598K]
MGEAAALAALLPAGAIVYMRRISRYNEEDNYATDTIAGSAQSEPDYD